MYCLQWSITTLRGYCLWRLPVVGMGKRDPAVNEFVELAIDVKNYTL